MKTPGSPASAGQNRWFVRRLLGVIVFACAFVSASTGIRWSLFFHPDEPTVARWMRQSYKNGYVTDRVYPGGWFVIVNAVSRVGTTLNEIGQWGNRHTGQDGQVNALEASSFVHDPVREGYQLASIQRGRDINVWLLSFSALLLFWMALEIGAAPFAAAFAALLFASQPFLLEHVHYCETDASVPFTVCLSGFLSARALRRGSWCWHFAAMFAAGFAVACKYTLLPLVLWTVGGALPLAFAPGRSRRHALGSLAALVGIGLILFGAGFLFGTPALLQNPTWFFQDAQRVSARTYGEAMGALGADLFRSAKARCLWRASSVFRELLRLGILPLLFYVVSIPFWLRRDTRRHLASFPLLLGAFLPHCIFLMPWIRNQELLPVLPPLCLGAALSVDWALTAIRQRPGSFRRLAAATLLLVLAASAFAVVFQDGLRMLSCFQRRDTRAECQNWLAESAGPGVCLALDSYVKQATRGTPCSSYFFPTIPENWPSILDNARFDPARTRYVLRNASFTGRRVLGSDAAERVARFAKDCTLIRSWKIAPGKPRPTTFSQPDIELWAFPDPGEADAPDLAAVLDRPVFFTPGLRPLYVADEAAPVGAIRAVPTVGQRHAVFPPCSSPSWAVSRVLTGPPSATIKWESLAVPRKRECVGKGTAFFSIDEKTVRHRTRRDVRPHTRIRLRDADDQATICATWCLSDPVEVAHALRRGDAPEQALSLLSGIPDLDNAGKTEAFLAATEAGASPLSEWRSAASETLAALLRALEPDGAAATGRLRIRGVPLRVFRDFAHLRLQPSLLPTPDVLPVFLSPGTYHVSVLPLVETPPPPDGFWFEEQTAPAIPRTDAEGCVWWDATVVLARESILRTRVSAHRLPTSQGIDFRRLEIAWDPAGQLPSFVEELRQALAVDNAASKPPTSN